MSVLGCVVNPPSSLRSFVVIIRYLSLYERPLLTPTHTRGRDGEV